MADLRSSMAELLNCRIEEAVFDDTDIHLGENWRETLETKLATCKCFVALISPGYIESDICGREWAAFSKRLATPPQPLVFPIIWQRGAGHPEVARLQFTDAKLGRTYEKKGLRYLIEVGSDDRTQDDSYEAFLESLCQHLHRSMAQFGLSNAQSPTSLDNVRSPFRARRRTAVLVAAALLAAGALACGALHLNARHRAPASRATTERWIAATAESSDPEFVAPFREEVLMDLDIDEIVEVANRAIPTAPGAARVLINHASRVFGGDPRVFMLDGSWLYQHGSYEKARAAFSRAIELGDSSGLPYVSRAKCNRQLGDMQGYHTDRRVACQKGLREACE